MSACRTSNGCFTEPPIASALRSMLHGNGGRRQETKSMSMALAGLPRQDLRSTARSLPFRRSDLHQPAFRDGSNLLSSGTVTNPARPDGFQGGTFNKTNTYQIAIGGRHEAGPLLLTADLARTFSKFTGSTESVDYILAAPQTINFDLETPSFTLRISIRRTRPITSTAASTRKIRSPKATTSRRVSTGNTRPAGRSCPRSRLESATPTAMPRASSAIATAPTCSALRSPASRSTISCSRRGFRGVDNPPFPDVWLAPTYDSIRGNVAEMRQFADYPAGPPPFDPAQSYSANEKTTVRLRAAQLFVRNGHCRRWGDRSSHGPYQGQR